MGNIYQDVNEDGSFQISDTAYPLFVHFTGIKDRAVLNAHIVSIQKKAYDVVKWPCIQQFRFAIPRLTANPTYAQVISNPKDKQWLDVGSCMGTDLRQLILEGFEPKNLYGLDISQELIDYGFDLFMDKDNEKGGKGMNWICANIYNNDSLHVDYIDKVPDLEAAKSGPVQDINEYKGKFDIISAGAVFHLFKEEEQADLAKRLSLLLSEKKESTIFGHHVGLAQPGIYKSNPTYNFYDIFAHSPESFRELWESLGFSDIKTELVTQGKDVPVLMYTIRR